MSKLFVWNQKGEHGWIDDDQEVRPGFKVLGPPAPLKGQTVLYQEKGNMAYFPDDEVDAQVATGMWSRQDPVRYEARAERKIKSIKRNQARAAVLAERKARFQAFMLQEVQP